MIDVMPNRRTTFVVLTILMSMAARAQLSDDPQLVFLEPHAGAEFRVGDEVPIVLSAYASADVFSSAELFANGERFAVASYCCPLCPCAHPTPGVTTILQIPVDSDPADPPLPSPWQGWKFANAGVYTLTARATGEFGSVINAPPVTITVNPPLDLSLHVTLGSDGTLHFRVPEGSLTPRGMGLELSHDLEIWQRIGSFSPGNVAAFYEETPDPTDVRPRFYRAVAL
jgi:hypothetical protein